MQATKTFAIATLLALQFLGSTASATVTADITEVSRAFHDRQKAYRNARITWVEDKLFPAQSLTGLLYGMPKTLSIPSRDVSVQSQSEVVFDEERMIVKFKDWAWSTPDRSLVPYAFTSLYDGKTAVTFSRHNNQKNTMLEIHGNPALPLLSRHKMIPILFNARPVHSAYGFNALGECTLDPEPRSLNGKQVLRLWRSLNASVEVWYLDPAHDCRLVRFEQIVNKQPRVQIDVSYNLVSSSQQDIPSAWRIISTGASGELLVEINATVTQCSLNGDISAGVFDLMLDKNTQVRDCKSVKNSVKTGNVGRSMSLYSFLRHNNASAHGKADSIASLASPLTNVYSLTAILLLSLVTIVCARNGPKAAKSIVASAVGLTLLTYGVCSAEDVCEAYQCAYFSCNFAKDDNCYVWSSTQAGCLNIPKAQANTRYVPNTGSLSYELSATCSANCPPPAEGITCDPYVGAYIIGTANANTCASAGTKCI